MSDLFTTFLENVYYVHPPEGENEHIHIIGYGTAADGRNKGLQIDDRTLHPDDKAKIHKLKKRENGLATFKGNYNDISTWQMLNVQPTG